MRVYWVYVCVRLYMANIQFCAIGHQKLRAATTKGKKRQQPQQKLQLQPQLQQRLQQRRSSPSFYIAATASAAVGVAVGVAVDVEHRRIPHRKLRKLH